MKSIKAIMITGGLISALIVIAAFINRHNEKIMKNLQTSTNSKGFAVLELFTSEGCSSCPPAEDLIEKIQKNNKNKQIFILAFHVDYWDHQGWKDKFSDPAFSKRQHQYAAWLNLQTLYTPQIVINGATEYIGSDEGPIVRTISNELKRESPKILTLDCKTEGNRLHIHYHGVENGKNTELVLALVQKFAEINVLAGENSGRKLTHMQIVRSLARVDISERRETAMDLPVDFKEKEWELIGFLQQKTDGHIIDAVRFDGPSHPALQK